MDASKLLQEIEELRRYVANTVGRFESLDVDQCEFTEQVLYRGATPCGVHFRLYGPRAVCLSAIWETDQNSILFYGSCGQRIHRTMLLRRLELTPGIPLRSGTNASLCGLEE